MKNKNGLTLLEILVAMVISMIFILSLGRMIGTFGNWLGKAHVVSNNLQAQINEAKTIQGDYSGAVSIKDLSSGDCIPLQNGYYGKKANASKADFYDTFDCSGAKINTMDTQGNDIFFNEITNSLWFLSSDISLKLVIIQYL